MYNKKNKITEVDLSSQTRAGIDIVNMREDYEPDHNIFVPHRDAHYLLMVITEGYSKLVLDFEEVLIKAPCILLMAPGQVHHVTEAVHLRGFTIKFDPIVINASLNDTFGKNFRQYFHIAHDDELHQQAVDISTLMYKLQLKDRSYPAQSIQLMLEALLNIVAGTIINTGTAEDKIQNAKEMKRAAWVIEKKFRLLLHRHYKKWKRPSLYASELNVSLSHLNDTIKRLTGYSISAHIQKQSILEANGSCISPD